VLPEKKVTNTEATSITTESTDRVRRVMRLILCELIEKEIGYTGATICTRCVFNWFIGFTVLSPYQFII
jgi:hypothetical protein